jgi:hypothetical protein
MDRRNRSLQRSASLLSPSHSSVQSDSNPVQLIAMTMRKNHLYHHNTLFNDIVALNASLINYNIE